jgi:4-amino-4-deoxy-L-arabinose transferase-like glycosyltransferase
VTRSSGAGLFLGSLLLVAVAAVAGLPGLGERDFWPQDEARYGTIALEMWNGAHPAVPHLNGQVYQDKPPGYFWLANVAARARGRVDEWAARVPSVLGAALLALGAFWMLAPRAGAGAGLLAGLIALGTWNVMWEARQAHLDVLFGGLIALAMAAYTRALEPEREGASVVGHLLLGLAIFVKGPLALLALATFVVAALILRRPGAFFNRYLLPGIVLLVLPCVLWLGWAYVHLNGVKDGAGYGYVHALVHDQVFERAQAGFAHLQPWHYYLEQLPLGLAPFLPLLVLAFLPAVRRSLGEAKAPFVVAACWLVLSLVAQSALPGKRLLYLVPLVAPFAVVCAAGIVSSERSTGFGSGWATFIGCLIFIAGGTLVAAALDDWVFAQGRDYVEARVVRKLAGDRDEALAAGSAATRPATAPASPAVEDASARARAATIDWTAIRRGGLLCGVAALVLSAIALTALALGAMRAGIAWTAAAVAVFVGLACGFVLPQFDPVISRRAAAEAARQAADASGPDAPLAFMSHIDEAFPYYAGRPLLELARQKPKSPEDRERARARGAEFLVQKGAVLVARRSDVANLDLAPLAAGGVSGPYRAGGQQFFILRGPPR